VDLGTGLASGSTLPLCSSTNHLLIVPTGTEIVCTLVYGGTGYTYVYISGFNALTTATTGYILIDGIYSPTNYDNSHVHIQVHSTNAGGITLDKRVVLDV
jgi:hypothetical protein